MTTRSWLPALMVLGIAPGAGLAAPKCQIGKIAELPVTMSGLRPTVPALINGVETHFIADSGAFYSVISPAAAAEFKLPLKKLSDSIELRGIGGSAKASGTSIREFILAGIRLANVDFLVGGGEPGVGAAGVLGQNVLGIADVEYDLANGAIRLMNPHDCRGSSLAYWVNEPQRYSTIGIGKPTRDSPHTTGSAFLNGKRVRVLFDTGASASILTLAAAERAGIKTDSAGVEAGGYWRGIGREAVRTWVASFDSFTLGDEEIKHPRIRIGSISIQGADMLIGADFFLSHRVYVATSQRRLYFTYNGGAVFNLTSTANEAMSAVDPGTPTDAAGFSRRGNAFAVRGDFDRALEDLTRACELAPTEARYFYERGLIHGQRAQPKLAIEDFSEALKLRPNEPDVHVARAEAHVLERHRAEALADLDAADTAVAKEADLRLQMGILYGRASALSQAIGQYDMWISAHPHDARMPDALNARCWSRALSGQDMEKALADCNTALESRPGTPVYRASRGLVHLRLGRFDDSIADFDSVLQAPPRSPFFLYARGVAKLRKGSTAEGQADIEAAVALQPRVVDEARRIGVAP